MARYGIIITAVLCQPSQQARAPVRSGDATCADGAGYVQEADEKAGFSVGHNIAAHDRFLSMCLSSGHR
jgi:hypothetical protein